MAETINDQQALAAPAGTQVRKVVRRNPIDTFMHSHTVRHFGRLIGLALAVAIGTVVVLWSSEPNYAPLYSNVTGRDASEIANVLTSNNIEYKIDGTTGTIMVAQSQAPEARLKLAAEGLPEGNSKGLEMLQDEQSLGTSQFIEKARYNHALENELARSIESIRSVEEARVHLALPKQSIFIRNRSKPSASVMAKLFSGRRLNQGQVDAIVHMVSSSVPMLDPSQVTVVDQFGRLLTSDSSNDMAQTSKEFEYTRKLENSYMERIIQLLQPIVGEGRINAQVSAALDFSSIESTREAYDPERSVIRSEQVQEQELRDLNQALGIPGALSNQPPGTGTTNPTVGSVDSGNSLPSNQNRSATRNYEVDRMISHTRTPRGSIQRLSVAVVIDSKSVTKDDGTAEKITYTEEEIAQFESLIKETIGFDENRGDSVKVINAAFLEKEEVVVEVPAWKSVLEEGWIVDLVKQILGAIGLLIIYLVFGRPFLKSLSPSQGELDYQEYSETVGEDGQVVGGYGAPAGSRGPVVVEDPDGTAASIRQSDATHEQKVEMTRTLVTDDPARVANVLKQWVDVEK